MFSFQIRQALVFPTGSPNHHDALAAALAAAAGPCRPARRTRAAPLVRTDRHICGPPTRRCAVLERPQYIVRGGARRGATWRGRAARRCGAARDAATTWRRRLLRERSRLRLRHRELLHLCLGRRLFSCRRRCGLRSGRRCWRRFGLRSGGRLRRARRRLFRCRWRYRLRRGGGRARCLAVLVEQRVELHVVLLGERDERKLGGGVGGLFLVDARVDDEALELHEWHVAHPRIGEIVH